MKGRLKLHQYFKTFDHYKISILFKDFASLIFWASTEAQLLNPQLRPNEELFQLYCSFNPNQNTKSHSKLHLTLSNTKMYLILSCKIFASKYSSTDFCSKPNFHFSQLGSCWTQNMIIRVIRGILFPIEAIAQNWTIHRSAFRWMDWWSAFRWMGGLLKLVKLVKLVRLIKIADWMTVRPVFLFYIDNKPKWWSVISTCNLPNGTTVCSWSARWIITLCCGTDIS